MIRNELPIVAGSRKDLEHSLERLASGFRTFQLRGDPWRQLRRPAGMPSDNEQRRLAQAGVIGIQDFDDRSRLEQARVGFVDREQRNLPGARILLAQKSIPDRVRITAFNQRVGDRVLEESINIGSCGRFEQGLNDGSTGGGRFRGRAGGGVSGRPLAERLGRRTAHMQVGRPESVRSGL